MALAAFGLFRAGETRRWRQLLPCAAAVALGVLLGGIQLLPTADAAAHSMRMGLTRDFALTFSLHPSNLLQLWSPYFFAERRPQRRRLHVVSRVRHLLGRHPADRARRGRGSAVSALPERRALIAAATAFAAIALILALGRYGGLAALLTHLPGLQSLRAPVRYIVLVQFALAILAAVTLDDLLAIAEGRSAPQPAASMAALWIPAMLGIATTVALNSRLLPYGRHMFASAASAAPGVAIVAVVTLLVYLAARRARWAIAALVVVTAADLGAWGIRFIYREPPRTIADLTQAIAAAPDEPAGFVRRRAGEWAVQARPPCDAGLPAHDRLRRALPCKPASARQRASPCGYRGRDGSSREDGVRHPFEGGVARVRLLDEQGQDADRDARGSPSIARDVSSRRSTPRAGACSRSPNASTMAGRRRSTASRARRCGWKKIFWDASWTAASTAWTSGSCHEASCTVRSSRRLAPCCSSAFYRHQAAMSHMHDSDRSADSVTSARAEHPRGPHRPLLGTGDWFRLMHLSSVPGISGDEGWWGVQALAWIAGQPYQAYTTSGNPTDLFFLSRSPPPRDRAAVVSAAPRLSGARQPAGASGWLSARPPACSARRPRRYTQWPSRSCRQRLRTAASVRTRRKQSSGRASSSFSRCSASRNATARGFTWPALLVFPVALWTHPTNIFIGPFLLLPCAAALRPLLPPSRHGRSMLAAAAALMVAAMLLGAWFALTILAGSNQFLDRPWLSIAAARLIDGGQWFEFAVNGARLFNGVTVYHYFSGARPATVPFDVIFVAVVGRRLCGFALARGVATRSTTG